MRLTGPTSHSSGILIAVVLCAAPLLASAQANGPSATAGAQVDATASAPVASPPLLKSAQPKKSLMGMVMAALIESAEQTARQRRDAVHQATALDEMRPSANTDAVPDPASVISSEDALHEHVAVQDDPL